jgi:anti-anti-sigma factor
VASFEAQPDPVFVFTGPEHVVAAANAAARRMIGDRSVLGRKYREAVPDVESQRMTELLDEAFRTAQPVIVRERQLLADQQGGGPPTEFIRTFTITPTFDADATVVGVTAHITDPTREVAARRTEQSRAQLAEHRYGEAREVVVALQRSLLPDALPVLPGTQLAGRYLVAGHELTAGGDWFDAIAQPDGQVGLIVGDVVGHGARASATMGQLRAVLTGYLIEGATVSEALARLDRFVAHLPAATATTVCLAVLEPRSGELSYACCGHPPPLLLPAEGGKAHYLPESSGGPLGTASPPPKAQTVRLAPGDLLLLYTDGLIERRDRSVDAGLSQLRQSADDAVDAGETGSVGGATVDRVCELVMEAMTRDGYTDDISLLGCQLTTTAIEPFHSTLPAEARALATLRRETAAWLNILGASVDDVECVHLALGEAVANCIEHAYPDGHGEVTVDGYLDTAGRVCLTVTDTGTWRPPPADPGARGRGLVMLRRFMDAVEVDISGPGTVVLMERTLRRYPVLAVNSPTSLGDTEPERPCSIETTSSDPLEIRVVGVLDVATTPALRRHLEHATRGGAIPVTLDLTGVEQLGSAAVLLLHELAEQTTVDHHPLRIIAPPGATARQVLNLTGLDHLAAGTGRHRGM